MFEKKIDLKVSAVIRPDFRRELKSGEYHLRLHIYLSPNERKSYPIKIYTTRKEWEKINSCYSFPTVKTKKEMILEIQAKANQIIKVLGDDFTFDDFEEGMFGLLNKDRYDRNDVYATFEAKIDQLRKERRIGSVEIYQHAMGSLKTFRKHLKFPQIDVAFLCKYEAFLMAKGCTHSTIGIHMRHLRTIVNMAKSVGIISPLEYPFGRQSHNKYEIPSGGNIKKAIPEDELIQLIRYEPSSQEAWPRDMWLFSFYCNGMNMVDIFNLKWGNIRNDFLYFIREKTKRTCRQARQIEIFLIPQVKEIIERWAVDNHRKKDDYIFGVFEEFMTVEERYEATKIALRYINNHMKKIGEKLNFKSKVTSFVARHTWATVMMRHNIPVSYISKGLGHTSMLTTERYLGDFDQDRKIEIGVILSGIGE